VLFRSVLGRRLEQPRLERGSDPAAVLDHLVSEVLPFVQHGDHPRFFARIPGPSNPVAVLADFLAAGLNLFVGSWTGGSGPATVELVVLEWLRDLCALPEGTEGVFVSGGSVATLDALAVGRTQVLGGPDDAAVAYLSDQTHAAVGRALRVLGFDAERVRVLPSDERLRLSPGALRDRIAADRAAGLRPFCVVASAGTTNTGAVDPLEELARLCRGEGLWLHVDAAYGGPALLAARGRELMAGIEHADSVAIDPHKWLFVPYECAVLLVRHAGALAGSFALHPEYLADVRRNDEEVNFFDRGVQLTRGARALKVWMTIKVFGLAELRAAVERGLELAEVAEARLREAGWTIVTPAQLAIVSFRREDAASDPGELDRRHERVVSQMQRAGTAAVSSTVLHGRTVLRMCTINPRTTEDDIALTVRALDEAWRVA